MPSNFKDTVSADVIKEYKNIIQKTNAIYKDNVYRKGPASNKYTKWECILSDLWEEMGEVKN